MKQILVIGILFAFIDVKAQRCECEKEFLYIKNTVEQNFAGFSDRVKTLSKATYEKETAQLLKLTHNKFASDNCPLIISRYLEMFKSYHLAFFANFDPLKIDTNFVNHRPIFKISNEVLEELKTSKSWEGIYYSSYDSSTKIVVIKDPTPLHDYVGVMLQSKSSIWKRGQVKFEGKLVNDSLLRGLLYMRNHRPKFQSYSLNDENNMIGGDWRREGTAKKESVLSSSTNESLPPIDATRLSVNTLYIKIASFNPDYKPALDSILKANEHLLNTTPNLILDLRDNGGGADDLWQPLIPYFYTQPIEMTGADALATETTIWGWKKWLGNKNFSEEMINSIKDKVKKMERAKGQWVNIEEDRIDSSFKPKPFPKKVVILINKGCGSSTEELLLTARQSSKVTLVGENTIGNLDYSNTVQTPFSCYPYVLVYASTRSRRLNISKGIDNIGIAPKYPLTHEVDWIKEALKILE